MTCHDHDSKWIREPRVKPWSLTEERWRSSPKPATVVLTALAKRGWLGVARQVLREMMKDGEKPMEKPMDPMAFVWGKTNKPPRQVKQHFDGLDMFFYEHVATQNPLGWL